MKKMLIVIIAYTYLHTYYYVLTLYQLWKSLEAIERHCHRMVIFAIGKKILEYSWNLKYVGRSFILI